MRASIFFDEPNLLREAKVGDLFIVHDPSLYECVCACTMDEDGDLEVSTATGGQVVVVIACRVKKGELGHLPTGSVDVLLPDTWITFVEPIETHAFRARNQVASPAPTAGAFTTCTCCASPHADLESTELLKPQCKSQIERQFERAHRGERSAPTE